MNAWSAMNNFDTRIFIEHQVYKNYGKYDANMMTRKIDKLVH